MVKAVLLCREGVDHLVRRLSQSFCALVWLRLYGVILSLECPTLLVWLGKVPNPTLNFKFKV